MRARIAPAGVRLGGQKGCFLGEGGEGAKKVFGVLPVATAQISSGLRFSSWRGRKKSLGEYLAGTGERPIFAPASDKDEGRGRGGRERRIFEAMQREEGRAEGK